MSDELKELVLQQISYYRHHKVGEMVKSLDKRWMVIEDYTKLLTALAKEVEQ